MSNTLVETLNSGSSVNESEGEGEGDGEDVLGGGKRANASASASATATATANAGTTATPPSPFLYKGENYLIKMLDDCEDLDLSLLPLGVNPNRNPFLLLLNVDR